MAFLHVAFGGFLGSILRFWISNTFGKHFFGTWIANVTGSLLLGIVFRFYLYGEVSEATWLFAGVGFCGAFTTFSTFGNETIQLLLDKRIISAVVYVGSTLFLSIGFIAIILLI